MGVVRPEHARTLVASIRQLRLCGCLCRSLACFLLFFQLSDNRRDTVVALILRQVTDLQEAVLLGDGVQIGDQFREVVCHRVHLIEAFVFIFHEGSRAIVVRLGIGVVQVLHVEVAEHQVALHALAGILVVHQEGLLQQIHRIFPATLFQRQRGQREENLIPVDIVLVVVKHLLQQLNDGFAIGFTAIERHGLLDFSVKLQLVRCAQIHNLVVALDGFFGLSGGLVALG